MYVASQDQPAVDGIRINLTPPPLLLSFRPIMITSFDSDARAPTRLHPSSFSALSPINARPYSVHRHQFTEDAPASLGGPHSRLSLLVRMTKVYPNANATTAATFRPEAVKLCVGVGDAAAAAVVLTVWKKSLLFNCSGFTVFDGKGNLVFRVDNYVAGNKGEIVLMDASGKPLLTIRRKRLSLGDNWLVYDGETAANPRFQVRKQANLLSTKSLARVVKGSCSGDGGGSMRNAMYEIEGSYSQRSCAVYDGSRRCVAEIKRKEAVSGVALGVDVFRLIVQPEMDTPVAMALVILLEQMFGSSKRLAA